MTRVFELLTSAACVILNRYESDGAVSTAFSMTESSHRSFLNEFKIAVNKLCPATPSEVRDEAKRLLAVLEAKPEVSEKEIHDALIMVGRQEFPYRRAYQELVQQMAESEAVVTEVLEHVEPDVRTKLEGYLKSGVSFDELVKSEIFEQEFTADQRYQVEHGLLDAKEHADQRGVELLKERQLDLERLVALWRQKQARMEKGLEDLSALGDRNPKWRDEILDRVETFKEGWSLVERDPDEETIIKEIEYWRGVLDSGA